MSKNKVVLDICGVQLSLTTEESRAYMEALAEKVRREINGFAAAGVPTREIAAVAAALSLYERLEKQQAPANAENEKLRAGMEKLQADCKALALKAKEEDKARLAEIRNLKKGIAAREAALQEETGRAERERDALREENDALRARAEAMEKELLEQEVTAKAAAEALHSQIAQLKRELQEMKTLQTAVEAADAKARDKTREAEGWRQQAAELQAQLELQEARAKRESDALCRELMELRAQAEREEGAPAAAGSRGKTVPPKGRGAGERPGLKNPMRPEYEQQGFVSFFEKTKE